MLELTQDNRSGGRLELVVPTFNEERRIGNLLRYYGGSLDIVLLDGGSTDQTVPLALAAGATVFRRLGQSVGDLHSVYYINQVSKSGLCFCLYADEFIDRSELETVFQELRDRSSLVLCRKAEWFYGRCMLTFDHTERRGFRKGSAQHNPDNLHENLTSVDLPAEQVCRRLFHLNHLQVWSVRGRFGKAGIYGYTEVEQFRRAKQSHWRFLRRYVVSLLGFPLAKAWRERNIGPAHFLAWMLVDLAEVAVGALSWLEQAFLMSPADQLAFYARFYQIRDDNPL